MVGKGGGHVDEFLHSHPGERHGLGVSPDRVRARLVVARWSGGQRDRRDSGQAAAARLGILYALFAVLATSVNLASQWVTFIGARWLGFAWEATLFPALIVGTGAGLIVKYVLDKRYIFADRSRGVSAHAKRFSLYTTTGLFTTAIFWATELLFALIDPTGNLIYLGGAIGLTMGYVTKYYLDRRYVFTQMTVAETNP